MFGLPECTSGSIEERKSGDLEKVISLADEIGLQGFQPKEMSRIGKLNSHRPRLLRIRCQDLEIRAALLLAAKKLRFSQNFKTVYVNPDRTSLQRDIFKKLRMELKRRKETGETVIIRGGKVVDGQREEIFHKRF